MVDRLMKTEGKERLRTGKVLVLGASGLIGSRFVEMFGGDNFITPSHTELDITKPQEVKEFIDKYRPDFVVNFIAHTKVGDAEKEREDKKGECYRINVKGVENILDAIDPDKTHFIQISTDMVFGGSKDDPGPYAEDHLAETDPKKLTWYGYTKAEAERLILARLGDKATIVRIIYPVRKDFSRKLDYLRFPLAKYMAEGKLYPLFTDQQVSITFIDEACEAIKKIVEDKLTGIFHASSPDTTTPHKLISGFFEKVFSKKVQLDEGKVGDSRRYPPYGGLNPELTEKRLGMKFSTTEQIVDKLIGLNQA